MKIVRKFRLIKLGNKVLDSLFEFKNENRVEREKDVYKNAIKAKVAGWLTDYKESNTNNSTDEK